MLAAAEARAAAEEASVLAAEAQAAADARAAELRVAQDSLRSMRQECNECWVSSATNMLDACSIRCFARALRCSDVSKRVEMERVTWRV